LYAKGRSQVLSMNDKTNIGSARDLETKEIKDDSGVDAIKRGKFGKSWEGTNKTKKKKEREKQKSIISKSTGPKTTKSEGTTCSAEGVVPNSPKIFLIK